MRTMILTVALIVSLSAAVPACSQAQTICDLKCDCEHCNDVKRDDVCATYEAKLEVAEAYGCEAEWEDLASCIEEYGACSEQHLHFSTLGRGICVNSFCVDSQVPCKLDVDCLTNVDLCADQTAKLNTCEIGATAHPGKPIRPQ